MEQSYCYCLIALNDWTNKPHVQWRVRGNSTSIEQVQTVGWLFLGIRNRSPQMIHWQVVFLCFTSTLLLPRKLGPYFLPHRGCKKYQQKPQYSSCSGVLELKNVWRTKCQLHKGNLVWPENHISPAMTHWETACFLFIFQPAHFLMQGVFYKVPNMPTEILFFRVFTMTAGPGKVGVNFQQG